MTNSMPLNTMVTLINLYLVYLHVKKQFERNISIKNAFINIVMHIPLTKSLANDTFGKDIVILNPLEAPEIKTLPLLMCFWFVNDCCCDISNQADFYIKNQFHYEYECIIPYTLSNTDLIESTHMSLLINDDITRHFVSQKFSYTHLMHCFFSYIN